MGAAVELPLFSKAKDDREPHTRYIQAGTKVVIFEGWRVGVQHPNFFGMSQLLDTLIFLKIDLDKHLAELYNQKKECAERDRQAIGGK